MNIAAIHSLFLKSSSVCTDTRKITKDCMFFALKGDNFNGNLFASEALEKGARYVVIDDKDIVANSSYILVEDVLSTLQQLASYHRKHLGLPIIALTGSNGKTTTKELINTVLEKKFKTVATKGNLNNHIGVPLTLLAMDTSTQIGIVEMGANHQQEIAFLCEIAQPDYGYITNFGKAHLEGFGGVEGVIKGKSELYDFLKQHGKLIFINATDEKQLTQVGDYPSKYSFGTTTVTDCQTQLLGANPFVRAQYNDSIIESCLIGAYNFNNISAAIAIGQYFKVEGNDIKEAIESYVPTNNRSQIIDKGSLKIILDAYNANPTSMQAALDNFNQLENTAKVAILGDMFELGEAAAKEHQFIADFSAKLDIDTIYLVGENFYGVQPTATNIQLFKTFDAFTSAVKNLPTTNATILIKGSRGMALERVLELV